MTWRLGERAPGQYVFHLPCAWEAGSPRRGNLSWGAVGNVPLPSPLGAATTVNHGLGLAEDVVHDQLSEGDNH